MVRKHHIQKGLLSGGLVWALLLVAASAQGMVYTWRDGAGTAHYTNKEYEIPSRYRARAKKVYPEATDIKSGSSPNNVEAAPPVLSLAPATVSSPTADNVPAVLPEKVDVPPPTVAPAQKAAGPAAPQKGRRQRIRTGDE